MNQNGMFEYEGLDLRLPPVSPRSRLFCLEPVGIGTPHVESLTGYASRLAETHCVRPAALFRELVIPAMSAYQEGKNGESFIGAGSGIVSAMNGIGVTPARVAEVLETFTSCKNLRLLTMLPWRDVVCHRYLLRRFRAWCPSCYEEGRKQGLVYEPLQWSLSCVEVCVVHRRRLWSRCPNCKEQIPLLTSNTRPGLCSKCEHWLGNSRSNFDPPGGGLLDDEVNFHLGLVGDVGEMLASSPSIESVLCGGSVARAISFCAEKIGGGSINKLADLMSMQPRTVCMWSNGGGVPSLGNLVRVSKSLGLSTLDFLTGNIAEAQFPVEPATHREQGKKRTYRPQIKMDCEEALRVLEAAQTEHPPPSMAELAIRISRGQQVVEPVVAKLRYHFPDVCNVIYRRYVEYRRTKMRGGVREILEQSLGEFPPPSMKEVARRITKLMGVNCHAQRFTAFRNLRYEITARHKNYKADKRRGEHRKIKEEVRRAASVLYTENSYPTINKVRAFLHMTVELSHVGRAALKEIRKEMGIQ